MRRVTVWLRPCESGPEERAAKGDIMVGVCFTANDQGEKVVEAFFKQLEEVSESQTLILRR